jgi:sugar O-acyltransferase (sialic acid O-acetyltransferase NeuD family)
VGASGHGRVVAEAARLAGHEVVAFVDQDPMMLGRAVGEATVVASQEELLAAVADRVSLPGGADAVAFGVGNNGARHALVRSLLAIAGAEILPAIVHPSAVVSPTARVGPGSVLLPRSVVHTDALVDAGVIVNSAAVVEHDCVVGACAHLSPGAIVCGGVTVGPRAWIGAGATVIHGRAVGADSVVGAGSVVIRNVHEQTVVVGVPARLRL